MEKNAVKRRQLRRKYRRYAAAVAGAAVITGATFGGVPVAKAMAAGSSAASPSAPTEQVTMVDKDLYKNNSSQESKYNNKDRGHHKYRWWSKYKDRDYYEGDGVTVRYSDGRYVGDGVTVRYLDSPVDYVKDYAASKYGFDAYRDTFTFLSLTTKEAVVQVTKHDTGKKYNITLERGNYRDWKVVSVRAI